MVINFSLKKVFRLQLPFRIFLVVIVCIINIIFLKIILLQLRLIGNFRIASNSSEINSNLKFFDSFNSTDYFDNIHNNLLEINKNLNFADEENLAGKYAQFIGINQTISFENEFRWPPFDINLREEVNRALNGQPEEHSCIDHWSKFPVIASPNCSAAEEEKMPLNNSLLIIVKTGAERSKYRNAVRETYGFLRQLELKNGSKFYFRLIFIMGTGNDTIMTEVDKEINQFSDILLADFEDNYYSNTIKFIHSIKFGHQNCLTLNNGSFPYVFLVDDDFLLLPWNLAEEAIKHEPNEHLYMGAIIEHRVERNNKDKWTVNFTQYPFDEYPKFVSGGAVLFSRRTIQELFLAIQHTQLYIFDDVYTGILTNLLGIQPQPNRYFISNLFSTQILNTKKKIKLININGWWKWVIGAMDFSPEMLRQKYAQAKNLYYNIFTGLF